MKSTSLHPLHWQAGSLPLAPPMGKLPPTPHRVCFSLRFGSTTFSGELWIWQTNNHISQTMTDTAREIIFTFKSPKSMTKHVTSVDGKTLVSAALGWEKPADWELLTASQKGLQNRVTYGPWASHSCDWQVTLAGFLTKACHSWKDS